MLVRANLSAPNFGFLYRALGVDHNGIIARAGRMSDRVLFYSFLVIVHGRKRREAEWNAREAREVPAMKCRMAAGDLLRPYSSSLLIWSTRVCRPSRTSASIFFALSLFDHVLDYDGADDDEKRKDSSDGFFMGRRWAAAKEDEDVSRDMDRAEKATVTLRGPAGRGVPEGW